MILLPEPSSPMTYLPSSVFFSRKRFYSWISFRRHNHEKLICQKTERATNNPRPRLKSSGKNASNWPWSQDRKSFFGNLFFVNLQKTILKLGTTVNFMRFSVPISAAVSDFLYLPPIFGKLILLYSCWNRFSKLFYAKLAIFNGFSTTRTVTTDPNARKLQVKLVHHLFSVDFQRNFRKCIGTN